MSGHGADETLMAHPPSWLAIPRRLVDALAAIDPDSPEAQSTIAPLVAMILRPGPRGMAGEAAVALSRFGASANAAVAPLRAARNDPDGEVEADARGDGARVRGALRQRGRQPLEPRPEGDRDLGRADPQRDAGGLRRDRAGRPGLHARRARRAAEGG